MEKSEANKSGMLDIMPVYSRDEQKELCVLCDLEYDPEELCYKASVGGNLIGICLFVFKAGCGIITRLTPSPLFSDPPDVFALEAAARTVLDLFERSGIKEAFYYPDPVYGSELCGLLEFDSSVSPAKVSLIGYFDKPCHGSNIKD